MHLFAKKFSWIGLGVFLSVLVAGLVFFSIYLIRGYRKVERFQSALNAYDSGNSAAAKRSLIAVLSEDPNNESALVKLAEVFHREGNWPAEAGCWSNAVKLNNFEKNYVRRKLDALVRLRDFNRVHAELRTREKLQPLTTDERLLLTLAALRSRHNAEGRKEYAALLRQHPEAIAQKTLGQFIRLLMNANNTSVAEAEKLCRTLASGDDRTAAVEAMDFLAAIYRRSGDDARLEEVLKRNAAVNRYAGMPELAGFYASKLRYPEAAAILEEYLKNFFDPRMTVWLGDIYVFAKQPEKLAAYGNRFRTGGKDVIRIGYYIDALEAMSNKNFPAMIEAFNRSGGNFNTPLARFIGLAAAVQKNSPEAVEQAYIDFSRMPEFSDLPVRARLVVLNYIQDLTGRNELSAALRLARIINDPDNPMLLTTRLIVSDDLDSGKLREPMLNKALDKFPNDPFLRLKAADYHLANGNAAAALIQLRQCRRNNPEYPGLALREAAAAEMSGDIDSAERSWLAAVGQDPKLRKPAVEFCVRNHRAETLRRLSEQFKKAGEAELSTAAVAEAMIVENRRMEALDILEKFNPADPELLFRTAYLLGAADRIAAATDKYEKLPKNFNRETVLINLSELYSAGGNRDRAMELAREAWQSAPDNDSVRTCMVRRLHEADDPEGIIKTLNLPRYKKNVDPATLDIWRGAMEKQIERLFAERRFDQAKFYCVHLRIYFPDNRIARDIENRIRESEKARTGKK